MTTLIDDIILNDDNINSEVLILDGMDKNKLSEVIYNFLVRIDYRIKALELYYDSEKEDTIEIINKITGIYQFSGSKILESFLFHICEKSDISSFLKFECAKSLHSFDENKDYGYIAINNVCKDINFEYLATPCKIDAVCLLMKSDVYKIECRNYFCSIINDSNIECNFRYKTILSLEKKTYIKNKDFYLKESCIEFLDKHTNLITHRILSAQYILQNIDLTETLDIKEFVENLTKTCLALQQIGEIRPRKSR